MTTPRCTGTTKTGGQCTNRGAPGTAPPRCRLHPINDPAHPKKAAFLAAYAELGNVSDSAETAGVGRTTHYLWLSSDPAYAEHFAEAHETAIDRLERAALARAVAGIDEPIYYKGKVVGSVRRYSDTLLIFLLKGARPEKYRERLEVRNVTPRDPSVDRAVLDLIGSPEALDQLGALGRVLSGASDDEA